jgi:hypothetical protein
MQRRAKLLLILGTLLGAVGTGAVVLGARAADQAPSLELHRDGVAPGRAISTKGTFSVEMPSAFNDFTIRAVEDETIGEVVLHALGGRTEDGMTFTATEIPTTPKMKPTELSAVPGTFAEDRANRILNVHAERRGGLNMATLTVERAASRVAMRIVKSERAVYQLVADVPTGRAEAEEPAVIAFRDSLRIEGRPPLSKLP